MWNYQWVVTGERRTKTIIKTLGVDISEVFDNVNRHKLLRTLEPKLGEGEFRMLQVLLNDIFTNLKVGGSCSIDIGASQGTLQGDTLLRFDTFDTYMLS